MPNLEEEILDPWTGFEDWYEKAHKLDLPNPNAALLATTNKVRPAARIVLIKDYAKETGFVFFTHYTSPKSRDLTANSHCCLGLFLGRFGFADPHTRQSRERQPCYVGGVFCQPPPLESRRGLYF